MDSGVMDAVKALRYSRQILATVANPALRSALAMAGRPGSIDGEARSSLDRFDWIDADGAVDLTVIRTAIEALEVLLTDRAVLHFERVRSLPSDEKRRIALAVEIVKAVFDRLDSVRPLSEERLNAALGMLVVDVAGVRRDAVDSGFLTRTPDGRRYAVRQVADNS